MAKTTSNSYVCKNCGYVGSQIKHVKGSFIIEIGLWFLMILPGFLYTIWRLASTAMVCPECKEDTMIKASSPIGQQIIINFKA